MPRLVHPEALIQYDFIATRDTPLAVNPGWTRYQRARGAVLKMMEDPRWTRDFMPEVEMPLSVAAAWWVRPSMSTATRASRWWS